jgi:hypothetical protein
VEYFGPRGDLLRSERWSTSVREVEYFGPRGGVLRSER